MNQREIHYSLGFNFDPKLVDGIILANTEYSGAARIAEVFAALPDSPVSSARPTSRIPRISWKEFASQVERLLKSNIEFNFLMNTAQHISPSLIQQLDEYLRRLISVGIKRLTVGTPELCYTVKQLFSEFKITISITHGVRSEDDLSRARVSGADSVYLDGVYVNRDFELLRSLLKQTKVECRLYANMSCLSNCPVVRGHYNLFAGKQSDSTTKQNDAYFAGCTMVKLNNPVEWIQMPWIRPEDISTYVSEGVNHFKLSDRLASTDSILTIAHSYLKLTSPDNLFVLMERDGAKYKMFLTNEDKERSLPISVESKSIPSNFIDHFRNGSCKSNNISCIFCSNVAYKAVRISNNFKYRTAYANLIPLIPNKLLGRING